MLNILMILAVLVAIILIAVVLIQNPKGSGLASNFATGNQFFGVKKTTDIVEKLTWITAAAYNPSDSNPASQTQGVPGKIDKDFEEMIEKGLPATIPQTPTSSPAEIDASEFQNQESPEPQGPVQE
jgi:preprotein translocase subunit SecG